MEQRGTALSIRNLKCSAPKKIPIASQNVSNYDYHFLIKELSEEFKEEFNCLRKNAQICITFTVPIKKKLKELIKMEKQKFNKS